MPVHYYIAVYVINGLWLAWMTYWLILAFHTKRTVYRQGLRQQLPYFAMSITFMLLVMLLPNMWQRRLPFDPVMETIGCSLCALGMIFSVWARVHLGRNWSGMITLKDEHELITSGPYAIVRHPIYMGVILSVIGSMLALQPSIGGLGVIVLLTGMFTVKMYQEEKLMLRQFPEQYPAYKARVRAAIIPFVV